MNQMNRVTAGHGSTNAPSGGKGGRLGSMLDGIAGARNLAAQHEHERGMQQSAQEHELTKMVIKHALVKDLHTHVSKGSEGGTGVSMDYEGIKTSNTKKLPKSRGAQAVTPEEHVETPAGTPEAASSESDVREDHHTGEGTFIGNNIPVKPHEWEGGFVRRNPATGKTEGIPEYQEHKTRKQHFETAMDEQRKIQNAGHAESDTSMSISNYGHSGTTTLKARKHPKKK